MRVRPAAVLALLAGLALAACGGSDSSSGGGAGGGGAGQAGPVKLGKKMPEFTPSGIKDEWKKLSELKSAKKYAKTTDEKAAKAKELADWLAEFPARWGGKEVPPAEGFLYGLVLQECQNYPEAVTQVRRWLEVAPEDNINYVNATTLLVTCLALSGDYEGASTELGRAVPTVYKDKDMDRKGAEETIAMAMMKAGQLEHAAEHFENMATLGFGDVESAIFGVDCWLRVGRTDEAVRLANKAADFIKEGKSSERAKQLVQQVGLVGRPAPGFAAAKWWKGAGGPITDDMMKGRVTVIFVWNMQKQWISWFFERLNKVAKEYAEKDVQFVGLSRLARFDPVKMATKNELTEEEELAFYEMWFQQYVQKDGVAYPFAIGGYNEEALIDAWAAHVVPTFVVVGKDGKVSYVRTGKEEEHFNILKEMIEKALK